MKLKLPSIHSLWSSFLKVILRFPLQVLVTIAATVSLCYLVDTRRRSEEELTVFIATCNLALTLLLAVDLYAEANQLSKLKQWGMRLIAVLICTGLYFILKPAYYLADVYRIGLLALAFHLLVAFAPFINKGNVYGFWQYNKSLFLRFLTSVLYAGVLYAGLAIALVAIDGLFSVKIEWQTYLRLFAVIGAGFTTIFFLAGVPDRFEEADTEESYPKGLKIFTQYVLIPLMTIYLVILLVYEAKIIVNWELPKGLVSTLILGYAVFGILSLLLIHPIKEKEGNGWMKLFSRFFYVMMIPLVVLLLLAVWKRVGSYGITESRYILVILAGWLTLITVYFLFSKKQNIKIIPVSLCILALLATYGPQSAFSVSRYSQVSRLKRLMASENKKDIKQRSEVVEYLVDRHGLAVLQPFTKVNLDSMERKIELLDTASYSHYRIKSEKTDSAYALLHIKLEPGVGMIDNKLFVPEEGMVVSVKDYDYIVEVRNYGSKEQVKINNVDFVLERLQDGNLKLKVGTAPALDFNVQQLAKNALALLNAGKLKQEPEGSAYPTPKSVLSLKKTIPGFEINLLVTWLNTMTDTDDEKELGRSLNYNGYLLIKVK